MVKIEKITIMKVEDLPSTVRENVGIKTGFVEMRVTRNSPPRTEINALTGSPLNSMREAFKREEVLGLEIKE